MRVALETMTVSSNNKTMQYIAAAVFAVIVGGTVALLMQKTDNPVTPDPELTGIAKATKLMSSSETAKDGFQILNELVNSNDAEATYLASRLYLGRMPEEYCPDSTRNMYLMLQNANCIEADYEKAHQLLEKAVALDSMNYQGLYELGRDVLAGNNRQHDVDLHLFPVRSEPLREQEQHGHVPVVAAAVHFPGVDGGIVLPLRLRVRQGVHVRAKGDRLRRLGREEDGLHARDGELFEPVGRAPFDRLPDEFLRFKQLEAELRDAVQLPPQAHGLRQQGFDVFA